MTSRQIILADINTALATGGALIPAQFGANSWVNTYLPGSGTAGAVEVSITSQNGGFSSVLSATRSSDNPSGSTQNVIADTALAVASHTSVAHNTWCRYDEGVIPASSVYREHINYESSLQNLAAAAPGTDPYNYDPTHAATVLRLDSGIGSASNDISTYLSIVNNGGKAVSGIVFGNNALNTTPGTADMLAAPPNYSITWYSGAGAPSAKVFSNATSGLVQQIFGNNTLDVFLGGFHPVALTTSLITLGYTTNVGGAILSTSASGGVGYATGAGGTISQTSSRTTGVTVNTPTGAITLVSAAGSASYQTFTVTNSSVAATDVIHLSQKSGADKYILLVTAVAAGSFAITFATTGGTTTEQPVFNFAVIKGVTS